MAREYVLSAFMVRMAPTQRAVWVPAARADNLAKNVLLQHHALGASRRGGHFEPAGKTRAALLCAGIERPCDRL